MYTLLRKVFYYDNLHARSTCMYITCYVHVDVHDKINEPQFP